MELGLKDKTALVSGSSRGIGLAVAEALLAEGSRVAITGRDGARVRETSDALGRRFGADRARGFEVDFSAGDEAISSVLRRAREELGSLDIVVANVGGGRGQSVMDANGEEWERMLGLNLVSAALTARHAASHFSDNGGSIVLISSIAGLEALSAPASYAAAKAGVIALGKMLARELAPRRIRVNTVSPGNVLHPEGSWESRMQRDPDSTKAYIESEVPLRRFGTPAEIAAAVVFLASDQAGFITGSNLVVDGGQSRGF